MIGFARRRMGCVGLFMVGLALAGTAWSQTTPAPATPANPNGEYVIGVGDELQVSVWAHPELERAVIVSRQGTIIFPPVGEIKAVGLTARQMSDRVADRLSTYLRQGASTVTITIKTYASQAVYVSGAVVTPGRYGGETVPTIMEAINLAGGAASNADLNRVTVIRKSGAAPFQFNVDVETAMRQGTTDALPALHAGDMIVVPVAVNLVGGVGNEEGVGVLGEVNRPGLYPVGPKEDLWAALALAGGPTGRGDLGQIKVLTRDQLAQGADIAAQSAVTVNLRETLSKGNKSPFRVHPGDIVFVDTKGITLWGGFIELLHVTADIANVVAIVRVLNNTSP